MHFCLHEENPQREQSKGFKGDPGEKPLNFAVNQGAYKLKMFGRSRFLSFPLVIGAVV